MKYIELTQKSLESIGVNNLPIKPKIFFDGFGRDYLYHVNTLVYGESSMIITPFPMCCGIRVINDSRWVPNEVNSDTWKKLLVLFISIDSFFSKPGKYMYVVPGFGQPDNPGYQWRAKSVNSAAALMLLDEYREIISDHYSYNPIMGSVVRSSVIISYNNKYFDVPESFDYVTPFS